MLPQGRALNFVISALPNPEYIGRHPGEEEEGV